MVLGVRQAKTKNSTPADAVTLDPKRDPSRITLDL